MARFISADAIVPDIYNSQFLNRYSYVLNDPVTLTDPSGLVPEGFDLWDDNSVEPEQGQRGAEHGSQGGYETIVRGERPFTPPPLVEAPEAEWLVNLRERGTPMEQLEMNYWRTSLRQADYDERRGNIERTRAANYQPGAPEDIPIEAEIGLRPKGVLGRFVDNLMLTGFQAVLGGVLGGKYRRKEWRGARSDGGKPFCQWNDANCRGLSNVGKCRKGW